ncbi:MAG: deoxyribodipyrimidine photo-lyase [Parvibaculum sp.]|nr:deoxyribodipyrimidine photo-lyase [Parvibaculum sp.]
MVTPKSGPKPAIVWFRRDLRLADNPALAAAARGGAVVPVFILDPADMPGGASTWWLHGSLAALAADLARLGAPLVLRRGDPAHLIPAIAREAGAGAVFWNRLYDPAIIARDKALKASLAADGFEVESFAASLLAEPWEVRTGADTPFKVFTPFWRALSARAPLPAPLPAPKRLTGLAGIASENLDTWNLRPAKPDWAGGLRAAWTPGEKSAAKRLAAFLDGAVCAYGAARNIPAIDATSRLSPHLHWGEISPRQIGSSAEAAAIAYPAAASGVAAFLRELGWRDFAHHLVFHWPEIATENWKSEFDAFPWADDDAAFRRWTRGETGYPIVDAGMRELWTTGFMHNRVRMIAASFLVKHLLIDWRRGAAWFEDTLVDADLAVNRTSWQWVAGSGADAAPYFRIFNPVLQGEKFDPEGAYVHAHLPELAALDARYIHKPWAAPPDALAKAGVDLGGNYPQPMIDHAKARARALAAYAEIRRPG